MYKVRLCARITELSNKMYSPELYLSLPSLLTSIHFKIYTLTIFSIFISVNLGIFYIYTFVRVYQLIST